MNTTQNQQPSTKKRYRSINFAAINFKFLIQIYNHACYNKQLFGAKYATYKAKKPRKCMFSVLLFFFFPLPLIPLEPHWYHY